MSYSHVRLVLALVAITTCAALITDAGHLIAVLADGDITDFGYNNNVNTGRVAMEAALNLSGTLFIPYLTNQSDALARMLLLAASGVKLIVSSTGSHGQAAALAAALYPNVSFVQDGGTSSPLPNLSTINWVGPDLYYVAGIFCGAMTTNNRIGFIIPGPPLTGYNTLNSFYVGAKTVNPNATIFTIFTDSFTDANRTKGASNILLNTTGVDMLTGHQNDYSLPTDVIAFGLMGISVTGFSLRSIYGESVGMSVRRDWGTPLTTYAAGALAGVFKQDITGDFASGLTFLDPPSFKVPSGVWDGVLAGATSLSSTIKPYFCGEWVAELGLNSTTGCLLDTTLFTSTVLSNIVQLGTY